MKPHCGYCCAHPGRIVVGVDHIGSGIEHTNPARECNGCYEMYGPCPFCDAGREFEFSEVGREMWGPDGFWKGIQPRPADIPETCKCYERPLGKEASIQRLKELNARVTAYLADARSQKTTVPRGERLSIAQVSDPVASNGTAPVSNDDEIGTLL